MADKYKNKTLYMETTKIECEATAAEIQTILRDAGASGVMVEYKDREVISLSFQMFYKGKELPFRLPSRHEAIAQRLLAKVKRRRAHTQQEVMKQARRVAWRQTLRWVESQLAYIESDMVKAPEMFMSCLQIGPNGETLFERFDNVGMKMLGYSRDE